MVLGFQPVVIPSSNWAVYLVATGEDNCYNCSTAPNPQFYADHWPGFSSVVARLHFPGDINVPVDVSAHAR